MKSFIEYLDEESTIAPGIKKYLERRGYKFLGKGLDAAAYLEPKTNKVLKVFGSNGTDKFSKSHEMFKEWVTFCNARKNNPFLPKFDGWETFEYDNELHLQIRMDFYGKIDKKMGLAASYIAYYVNGQGKYDMFMDRLDKGDLEEDVETLVIHLGEKKFKLFWKTLQEMSALRKKYDYGWDTHDGNFMFRNDGTPVIVDPFAL